MFQKIKIFKQKILLKAVNQMKKESINKKQKISTMNLKIQANYNKIYKINC